MFRYTIITYNHNNSANIIKHLASLINIDFDNYEIIIIDDNSHDNSLDLIQNKLTMRNNIKTISSKYHRGVFNCLNTGIDKASGQYIMFTNSNYIVNNDIFKTIEYNINEKGNNPDMIEYKISKKSSHDYMNMIISNQIIKDIGYFDTFEYYSDWEYKYRIRKVYTPYYIDIVLSQQIKYDENEDIDYRNNIYFKNKFSGLENRIYIPKDNRLKLLDFELEPYVYSNEDVIINEDVDRILCKQFFKIFKKSEYKLGNIDNKENITFSYDNKIMSIVNGKVILDIGIYKISYSLVDNKVITFEPVYCYDIS
jgi:glycosyltransferase involved in cell wall biosynthesis